MVKHDKNYLINARLGSKKDNIDLKSRLIDKTMINRLNYHPK